MNDSAEHWAKQAHYDLETARAMLDSGRYLYVLFCCQQAVEKMLKSIIARHTQQLPPRIHQLMRLIEVAGLPADENQAEFLRELSAYYIQTRYPDELADIASQVKQEEAQRILKQTMEMLKWLSTTP